MNPRAITVLTTSLPHREDPVAGVFVAAMCRALARRGHRVTAVFIAKGGGDVPLPVEGVTLRAVECPGHPFYGAGAPDALYSGARAWVGAARAALSLWREARSLSRETDGWVSNFIVPCGAIAGAVRGSAPHVAVVHGSDAAVFSRLPRAARGRVLAGVTRVWCSHAGLAASLGVTAVPVTARPMGWWATSDVAPPSRSAGEGSGVRAPLLVLVVSRLIPLKGVDRVARAVALLRDRGRAVSLVVAGDGPERASLERAFPWATWLGAVEPATRDALMARATVLVHAPRTLASGRTEGAPTVIVEAMAAGLPVVATDVGGVRELVGDAGAIVAGDASDAGLARALGSVLDDEGRRAEMARRGSERAAPWEWDAQAEALERELFGEATGERPRSPEGATN